MTVAVVLPPTVDQLLNWGPIIGVLCFHAQTTVLQRPRGLQRGIWWGLGLLMGGNVLRCIPIAVTEASGGARPRFAESGAHYSCASDTSRNRLGTVSEPSCRR